MKTYTSNDCFLVHITEEQADFSDIFKVANSYHVAQVLVHDYIAELEAAYGKDIMVEKRDSKAAHPTMMELWHITSMPHVTHPIDVAVELHEVKNYQKCV